MLKSPKVIHLEPTDVCQAACPLCARETNPLFDADQHHHLTIEQIVKHVSVEVIQQLDKMFMCGNYGDPAAAKHALDIFRFFRQHNPEIVLGMNTNGGIQSSTWWQELATILNQPRDYVVFSIDGLEDTNAIYRRGVVWDKVMTNTKAFIASGGSAHWDMLVYAHNEHQVDECLQLARHTGFRWFRAKVSKRPLVEGLKFPETWSTPINNVGEIDCHALREQSVYIDARGQLHPCCWLGEDLLNPYQTIDQVSTLWATTPPAVCTKSCGKNFDNQWRMEIQL